MALEAPGIQMWKETRPPQTWDKVVYKVRPNIAAPDSLQLRGDICKMLQCSILLLLIRTLAVAVSVASHLELAELAELNRAEFQI